MSQVENNDSGAKQPEVAEPSMKQRVELALGKNVPIDYFLFSCLEHERTLRAQFGEELPTGGRWPLMVGATIENCPATFKEYNLPELLSRMCGWYAAQYPELVEEIPLDHVILNQVVAPFMNFTIDVAELVYLKTQTSLPSHNADTPESNKVWKSIAQTMQDVFPGYHGYFIRFLKWAFADIEPEDFEPGSRPPVGKNMPNFRAIANAQNPAPQKQHQRGSSGGGAPSHQNNRPRHDGPRRDGQQNRDGQHGDRNRGPRGQGGGHQGNHSSHSNHQKPKHNQQADSEMEKQALASVDEAISKITSGQVEEVFLKPMNSFYRRIQHQYAVDKGFESTSVGEGQERGVKVAKPLAK
jgi:hypothetical protein